MMNLPAGTITFLFTDIEGSTRIWEEHPEEMRIALARHDALLRQEIERNQGVVFKTMGDAFCAAFATAPDALSAALGIQRGLAKAPDSDGLSLRVRIALHTGTAELRDDDYFGQPLNRVSRILAAAHGGQVLLSDVAHELCSEQLLPAVQLKNLGEHRLCDLTRPETIYQLLHPELPAKFPPLKSLNNPEYPNNLPQQVTSFIGREKEMAEVTALLPKTHLLTLTGTGGSGKTRLSLQVAAELLEEYPDGVWQVELAPLSDSSLVVQVVCAVLGVKEQVGQPQETALTDFLKNRQTLILLDNAEHVLDACAQVATLLLRSCPKVRLIVTSREALGIFGEQVYRVPTLSLPDPNQPSTIENVSHYEAVRLFIDRARLVKPDFFVTNENAPAVAELCLRLDGIPLALELAAARVRAMPVEQVASRLDDRFRLLTGGSRTALPRQQTLRALIDWSYDLLSETERILLRRLSVFVGGWTLEAAEAVCAGGEMEAWEMLDTLMSLVDKSLVIYQEQAESSRYRFMESIREYARGRLQDSGEAAQVQEQHLSYFVSFSEMARKHLVGAEQRQWMERLEAEHDNLRAALTWCETSENGAEAGLRLTASLWKFWDVRGYWHEGIARYRAVLSHPGASAPTADRSDALQGAGMFARNQSDYPTAREMFEESLRIRTLLGNRSGMAQALNNIGAVDVRQGDYAQAKERYKTSLEIRRELGDKLGMAACLLNLGVLHQETGENEAAFACYTESLALCKAVGDQGNMTILLTNMGNLALSQNDGAQARSYYEQSLSIARETGDKFAMALALVNLGPLLCNLGEYEESQSALAECLPICGELGEKRLIAYALEGFALLATALQQPQRATRLSAAGDRLRETLGAPLAPNEQAEHAENMAANRAALGSEAYTQCEAEGRALTLEQAVAYALS